ncbi:Uncharacterised protein [Klebsiella pneumoniae]|nr:Uncharacterised protein [Klebsiella pneumoniae]
MPHRGLGQTLFLQRRGVGDVHETCRVAAAGRVALETVTQRIHGDVLADNLPGTLAGVIEVAVAVSNHLTEQQVWIGFATKQLAYIITPGFPAGLRVEC